MANKLTAQWERWRAGIPFTNDQIADALDAQADHVERGMAGRVFYDDRHVRYCRERAGKLRDGGMLARADYLTVLDRLVTTCGICGAKAIYRMGSQGRCRDHANVITDGIAFKRALHNGRSAAIVTAQTHRDKFMRMRQQVASTAKWGKR